MAQTEKITKVLLHEFVESINSYVQLYPQTSGDMVIGQVSDSKLFDGKTTEDFVPSVFTGYAQLKDSDNTPQGLVCGRVVISNNLEDSQKISDDQNALWVKGIAYVNNGDEVASKRYVENKISDSHNNLQSLKVDKSTMADRLALSPKINGILFNGDKDVTIPYIVFTQDENHTPLENDVNHNKLWITLNDGVAHYYYNTAPGTGQWHRLKADTVR